MRPKAQVLQNPLILLRHTGCRASSALEKQPSAKGGQLELHDQICQMPHKVPRQSINHRQHLLFKGGHPGLAMELFPSSSV